MPYSSSKLPLFLVSDVVLTLIVSSVSSSSNLSTCPCVFVCIGLRGKRPCLMPVFKTHLFNFSDSKKQFCSISPSQMPEFYCVCPSYRSPTFRLHPYCCWVVRSLWLLLRFSRISVTCQSHVCTLCVK